MAGAAQGQANTVSYLILGPLQVAVNGKPVPAGGRRQRAALALLLANLNRVTGTENLIRVLWGDDPPETAVGQIQTLMWRLRGLLGEAAIITHAGGYELRAPRGDVDAARFADLAAEGIGLARTGRRAAAAARLGQALSLWRGPVLADLSVPGDRHSSGLHAAAAELGEQRLAAERERLDAELALGRHAELIPPLSRLVQSEPLREELRQRLMLALYRAGRRAEALAVYRQGREATIAELGLEPGRGLQELHSRILGGDPELDLDPPPEVARVCEVPMDAADFVAHEELAHELADVLLRQNSSAPPVVVISGAAGSGKTALAVHVAHLIGQRFTGGQLFADLRGMDAPAEATLVLARFLRSLGVDPRLIPADQEERAALFRARTNGKRTLLVLDNAAGEVQVRPLLPATAGCAVLITSRRRLAGLPAAHHVDLGVFTPEQSLDLLQRMIGPARVTSEREDCVSVAARCGYLPLAIRIAGARLAARPHWPVARLADQLADARARLDVLRTGDLEVRSSLALGFSALTDPQRQLLCLLGAVNAPAVPGWLAAALLDLAPAEGEELTESLVDARFVDVDAPGRYRLHDLVRAFAQEQAGDGDCAAALTRAVSAWLALAEAAHDRLPGGFRQLVRHPTDRWNRWEPTPLAMLLADPVRWCEQERHTLVAAVAQAAELAHTGPPAEPGAQEARQRAAGLAWSLATTLARFFELREHLDDWRVTHEEALRACLITGDLRGEAHLRRSLGELSLNLDQLDGSFGQLSQALRLMEQIGDRRGEAAVLRAIGTVHRLRGRYAEAMACLTRAEELCQELDDLVGQAQVLHNIGAVHRLAGRQALAEQSYRRALGIFELAGDRFGEAFTLCSLGMLHRAALERCAEVEGYLQRSVELCTELEYWRGAGIALGHLGDLHLRLGQTDRAVGELRQALAYCREVGDSYNECTELRRLGEAHLANGQTEAARAVLGQALAAAADVDRTDEHASIAALLATLDQAADRG